MGVRPRKISVNFWRINPDTINGHWEKILMDGFDALDCSTLSDTNKGESYSLDSYGVEAKGDYITGALVHSQHAGLPVTYKRGNKQFGQVPLQPDQGLGRVSCFVYDRRRRLLLLESPGEGSSTARDWCLYFRTMIIHQQGGRFTIIHPAIVERLDAHSVFNRLERVTQLKIHIARLRDVSMFRDQATREALISSFKIADESGSDEVICTFKVPAKRPTKRETDLPYKPSLKNRFVKRVVKAMEALDPREITKLEVVGQEEDMERMTTLNLLANRVVDSISAVPFTDKELPSLAAVRHRCELIQELFDKHALVLQSVAGV